MNTSFTRSAVIILIVISFFGIGRADSRPWNQPIGLTAGKRPLYFIPNQGQFHEDVAFCARASIYSLWITTGGITFDSWIYKNNFNAGDVKELEMTPRQKSQSQIESARQFLRAFFPGANEFTRVVPLDETDHHVNFLIGKKSSEWRTGIPTSRAVLFQSLYPGIDLKVNGAENLNTYVFFVKPGGEVSKIEIKYQGCSGAKAFWNDNLTFEMGRYELQHLRPKGYLYSGTKKQPIEVKFRRTGIDSFGFDVEHYDERMPLVIYQDITVSIRGGGVGSHDMGYKIAVDSSGEAYITGRTHSADFPADNSFRSQYSGGSDVFVAKLNTAGTSLVYSTYLGGSSFDYGKGVSVDSNGAVYVTGITNSSDFPTRHLLYEHRSGGFDAFVAKLDPSGQELVYSTYLGGADDDSGQSLAVDSTGAVYVVGWTQSRDFPAYYAFDDRLSGARDVFVTKIHPLGKALIFSTYLGGASLDFGKDISLGSSGTAWVTGYTRSFDFPVKEAIFPELSGKLDAFVTQFDASGRALVFSTYLGGSSNDIGNAVSNELKGSVFLTGYTQSGNFPLKNAFDESLSGSVDAFVVKIRISDRSLVYSTYLGGSAEDSGCDVEVDSEGAAYLTGYTYSKDFPVFHAHTKRLGGDRDAFVTKIDPAGSSLGYSTYLGGDSSDLGRGIVVDRQGSVYVTGCTCSRNFPIRNTSHRFLSGRDDAFVSKFNAFGSILIYSTYLGGSMGLPLFKQDSKIP